MPFGIDVGHLTERHVGTRHHGGYQLVLYGFVVVGVVVLLGIQPHRNASAVLPNGGQRLAVETARQVQGKEAFGEAQAGTFLGFHGHLHRWQLLVIVGVHPTQLMIQGEHVILDLLRHGSGLGVVIAIDVDLNGCGDSLIVQLAETHVGFREVIGIFVIPLFQQSLGSLFRGGVDNELREVGSRDAG